MTHGKTRQPNQLRIGTKSVSRPEYCPFTGGQIGSIIKNEPLYLSPHTSIKELNKIKDWVTRAIKWQEQIT